jgi:hypothetical protein
MTVPTPERRKFERYDTEVKIYFQVKYSLKTLVQFRILDRLHRQVSPQKYSALSKNISAEGLCFTSPKVLTKDDILILEVYLPEQSQPILMEGEVRWSKKAESDPEDKKMDSGIRIISVNGQPVDKSIYFDPANKIVWSAVLESIFGNFREFSQKRKR